MLSKYNGRVFTPTLTAIMPVTKMAGKLTHLEPILIECVRLGIEVVIVHDKQDDKTEIELRAIMESVNSQMIRLVTKTLFSPGKARNLGKELAKGDWICFWDSDDIPVVERFLEMVTQAIHSDHAVVAGKFRQVSRNVTKVYGITEIEIGRMPGIWRFAFNKTSIKGETFPEYRMGEDQVFLAKTLDSAGDYFKFEEIVYEYRCDNPEQLTQNRKAILDLRFAIEDMLMKNSHSENRLRVGHTFLARQILTLLKHGTLDLKLRSIRFAFNGFQLHGRVFLTIFLREILVSFGNLIMLRRSH